MEHCPNCSKMHRRAQKAEGEVARLQKLLAASRPNPWKSEARQLKAEQRDHDAQVIQRIEDERRRRP